MGKFNQLKSFKEEKVKVSKLTIIDTLLPKYVTILSDGQPHLIPDLLKTFELPNTSNGREKLRCMNTKINSTGKVYVAVINVGKNRSFQLKHVQED